MFSVRGRAVLTLLEGNACGEVGEAPRERERTSDAGPDTAADLGSGRRLVVEARSAAPRV